MLDHRVQLFARNHVYVKTCNMQSGSYKPYVPALDRHWSNILMDSVT